MSDNDKKAVIRVHGLSKDYVMGTTVVRALREVQLQIEEGEFVAIMGPSGSGKSTFMNMVGCLDRPSGGEYWLNGVEVSGLSDAELASVRNKQIGFVFQHPTLLPWRTAEQNLRLPLELGATDACHLSTTAAQKSSYQLLEQVGLSAQDATKRPGQMSGGMQMRLSLARALVTGPNVLLLDEPFAAVDDFLRLRLQEDIRRLHDDRRLTTVLVTHNIHEAVFLSDRVIVFSGSPAEVKTSIEITWPGSRDAMFRNSDSFVGHIRQLSLSLFDDTITSVAAGSNARR